MARDAIARQYDVDKNAVTITCETDKGDYRPGTITFHAKKGKAIDLEKLRTRALLREFATYTEGRGKLKLFRTEAIRAGFAAAWRERDYMTITGVAERLPEPVLQEDPDLLMYYDTASLRVRPGK